MAAASKSLRAAAVLVLVLLEASGASQLLTSAVRSGQRVRRVFNGFETVLGEFPFCVLTAVWTGVANINCSGTLISDNHVLTAAHCYGDDGVVLAGNVKFESERDVSASWVQKDYIREFILYDQDGADSYHDIMLVRLKHGFYFNFFVNKIALAARDSLGADWEAVGTFVGFGVTSSTPTRLSLQRKMVVSVKPVLRLNFSLASSDVVKRSACHGDSGGPLVIDGELYGILSGGSPLSRQLPCGPNQQNVFMFVGYYKAWIEANSFQQRRNVPSTCLLLVPLLLLNVSL